MTPSLYPLFLNLRDRLCIVVGGNEMAEAKAGELLDAGARIRLIAPEITNQLSNWAASGKLNWEARAYEHGDLRDAFLVVSVADAATNARVFAESEAARTFCNSVDDVSHCSCYAPAVVRRGPLQIAISTAGNSPALAQRLRKEFEDQFGEEYTAWVQQLGEKRRLLFQDKIMNRDSRRQMLHELASVEAFENFRRTRNKSHVHTPVRDSAGSPKSR